MINIYSLSFKIKDAHTFFYYILYIYYIYMYARIYLYNINACKKILVIILLFFK